MRSDFSLNPVSIYKVVFTNTGARQKMGQNGTETTDQAHTTGENALDATWGGVGGLTNQDCNESRELRVETTTISLDRVSHDKLEKRRCPTFP